MTELGRLELSSDDGRTLARLSGELDTSNVPAFGARIRDAAARSRLLVVDLSEVTYFDSSGVHLLHELAPSGALRVVAPEGSRARVVLRICAFPAELIAETPEG